MRIRSYYGEVSQKGLSTSLPRKKEEEPSTSDEKHVRSYYREQHTVTLKNKQVFRDSPFSIPETPRSELKGLCV